MLTRQTYELPASPASSRLARELVRDALSECPPPVVDVAQLLVSELVANAVHHCGCAPLMRIEVDPSGIRVAVQDTSPDAPKVQGPSSEATGGRGLVLVDALAVTWGWSSTPQGKRVWFTL